MSEFAAGQERTGVIHDIGYRGYSGPRESRAAIARSLLASGLLAVFGFGRSGKAKVLPFVLLGFSLIPAVVFVGLVTFLGPNEQFLDYPGYNYGTAFLMIFFVAAQSPVLFSRDLRSGVISLYLARPLGPAAFALTRWASLVLAILIFALTPVLILFIGGLSAGAQWGDEWRSALTALLGGVLFALMLATYGAVISSVTLRRGLAIGGTIVALLVGLGVTTALSEVASMQGQQSLAEWLALLSPFVLLDSVQTGLGDAIVGAYPAPPESAATAWGLLLAGLAMVALGVLFLIRRYRTKGTR